MLLWRRQRHEPRPCILRTLLSLVFGVRASFSARHGLTLMRSIGWMTADAKHAEKPPQKNGLVVSAMVAGHRGGKEGGVT